MGLADEAYANRSMEMTPLEREAWALYCAETAGDMDVRDAWWELSPKVQHLYLDKVQSWGTTE